ncbi:MAG: cyclically-permuted mutarotase family protein, partial [Bacteroidales bacterium]|nr:cyclically-permuted mutarotase family protein [Bacteroidales bacterium]
MKKILFIGLSGLLMFGCSNHDEPFRNVIQWEEIVELPPSPGSDLQPGLAKPFAGESNGVLIVAGGANFPDKPVYEGGKKVYHKDIFVLTGDRADDYLWISGFSLPERLAYGVSIPWKNGVLCIGGKNEKGESKSVFKLTWNSETRGIDFEKYPDLPFGIADMGGDIIDGVVYLAGGSVGGQASNSFLKLDLNNEDPEDIEWVIMEDFRGPARVQPVMIAQNAAEEKHLYLMSGSSHTQGSDPLILTDGLEYNPKTGEWRETGQIAPEEGKSYSLHGAEGIAQGVQHMMFIGGVNKDLFFKAWKREIEIADAKSSGDIERVAALEKERHDYLLMDPKDFKLNRDVLIYHTITETWSVVDKYPYPGPAGAPVVKKGDRWFVINGEIKAGVRSPKVYSGTFSNDPSLGTINWIVIIIYLIGMLY